jgi:hypothetical protein
LIGPSKPCNAIPCGCGKSDNNQLFQQIFVTDSQEGDPKSGESSELYRNGTGLIICTVHCRSASVNKNK